MATNPMQRKARSSFILGFFLAILIMGAVAGFLAYQLIDIKKEQEEIKATYKKVAVLSKDKTSGDVINQEDCKYIEIPSAMIPNNYVTIDQLLTQEENSDEAKEKQIIAKVDLQTNTMLTTSTVTAREEIASKDTRTQEYNMIALPTQLDVGNYIDIRLTLPNGEDFVVVSKKQVKDANEDTIWLDMTEEETVVMSNAIIEHYIMLGSKLYATIYVEAGMQENLTPTYVPSGQVKSLLSIETQNGNASLTHDIYGEGAYNNQRENIINSILSQYEETRQENIEQGIEDEVTRMKESREEFFTAADAAQQTTNK